jgi:O-antigen/teichoic acid export membrane protein
VTKAIPRPAARGPESIRRNAAFALGVRVGTAVFTAALTLFLARYLGPESYGVFALALSVGGLFAAPADFGVSFSAARFIAERRADPSQGAAVLRKALGLKLVGAGLTALALLAAAGPIANAYGVPELETPLRIMAAAVFGQSFVTLFMATFEALGRNSLGLQLAVMESISECGATILIVLAGGGIGGAASGRAIGYAVGALAGLALAFRVLGHPTLRSQRSPGLSARAVARYAGALFLIDVAFSAFTQIDSLLIGAFLNAQAVGLFNAPLRILALTEYPGLALAGGLAPRLARGPGHEPNVAAFETGLRLVLIIQLVLVAPIVVWATPITQLLLGSGYADSADVLRALGPYVALRGPGTILALGINYLGEARRRVPLALVALAVNAGIDIVLIPRIGIVAGAIGTGVASLVFIGGHLVICKRLLHLQLMPLAKTFIRSLIAAGAMAGVLFLFGTSSLTAAEAVAGTVLGLIAYGAVLFATGEVTRAELRSIPAEVRGLISR